MTSSSNSSGSANSSFSSVLLHPDYAFDTAANAAVTNLTIADNPAPQNTAFLSPNAVNVISAAITNQPMPNLLMGLKVMAPVTGTTLSIAVGSAADSTNTRLMTLPASCPVDLNTIGLGGRDAGTTVGAAIYNIFIVAPPGQSATNCIASIASQPSFYKAGPPYRINTVGMTVNGSTVVYNVGQVANGTVYQGANNLVGNPLSGIAMNDVVTGAGIPSPTDPIPTTTTIASLQPINVVFPSTQTSVTISATGVTSCLKFPASAAPLDNNPTFAVGFNVAGMNVQPSSYLSAVTGTACGGGSNYAHFSILPLPTFTSGTSTVALAVGSDFAIKLSNPATATSLTSPYPFTPTPLTDYAGTFRQVCTVKTGTTGTITTGVTC